MDTEGYANTKELSTRIQGYVSCTSGNTTMAFMRDTLAPFIKPRMRVYEGLKLDIFGSQTNS